MAELLLELYSEEIPPQLQIAARSQIKEYIENSFKVFSRNGSFAGIITTPSGFKYLLISHFA